MLEELFEVTKHRVTLSEAWQMPIEVRRWWIDRARKEKEREKENRSPPPGTVIEKR